MKNKVKKFRRKKKQGTQQLKGVKVAQKAHFLFFRNILLIVFISTPLAKILLTSIPPISHVRYFSPLSNGQNIYFMFLLESISQLIEIQFI